MSSTLTLELDNELASDLERLARQANTSVGDLASKTLRMAVARFDRETRARETAFAYFNKPLRSGDGKALTRDEIYDRGSLH